MKVRLHFVVAIVFLASQPGLASNGAAIDPLWERAIRHDYKTKKEDLHTTLDPHRYNVGQLEQLTFQLQSIDNEIASDKSYLRVLGQKNLEFYDRARDVALRMFNEGAPPFDGEMRGPMIDGGPDDPMFEVNTLPDVAIDTDEEPNWSLVRLSYEFIGLFRRLKIAGYSNEVTQQALMRFERRELQRIADAISDADSAEANAPEESKEESKVAAGEGSEDAAPVSLNSPTYAGLTLELESQRLKFQPEKPRFVESDGLGAGGLDVAIHLVPNDGVAMRISRFDFLFCQLSNINPYDRSKCHGWYAMRDGESPNLSGNYEVFVTWPTGRKLRTQISVDKQQSLTFRAPK